MGDAGRVPNSHIHIDDTQDFVTFALIDTYRETKIYLSLADWTRSYPEPNDVAYRAQGYQPFSNAIQLLNRESTLDLGLNISYENGFGGLKAFYRELWCIRTRDLHYYTMVCYAMRGSQCGDCVLFARRRESSVKPGQTNCVANEVNLLLASLPGSRRTIQTI